MNHKIDLKEVKKQLPHGAFKAISEKTGINQPAISNVFNGIGKPTKRLPEILEAAAEIIAANKAKERKALEAIQSAISEIE